MPRNPAAFGPVAQPLFDDFEVEPGPSLDSGGVAIRGHREALSPEQKRFNQLTTRIRNLEARIAQAEKDHLELKQRYSQDYFPAVTALGESRVALAMALDEAVGRQRATKTEARLLKRVIPLLLQSAFGLVDPTPEALILHDKYAQKPLAASQRNTEVEEQEAFLDLVEGLGFEVPPEVRDQVQDPQAMEAFAERIQREFLETLSREQVPQRPRKKTKKALEREAKAKEMETLKQRSLRDVYIALARVLHPDIEPEASLKVQKEDLLKRATVAYEEGNLMALLRLEMDWLESTGLQDAPTDKLTLYLELLKDQVKDLEGACREAENRWSTEFNTWALSRQGFLRELREGRIQAIQERGEMVRFLNRVKQEPTHLEACLKELLQVLT